MKKTTDVAAKNLKRDDHIKIGGEMYRITNLNLRFGGKKKFDRVTIHAHGLKTKSYVNLSVASSTNFTIFNQK